MSRKYYKPDIDGYSDEKIIKLVFEDKESLYDSLNYMTEADLLDRVTNPKGALKRDAKDIGKSLLNFLAFKKICRNIAASLNKNWALKRAVGQAVKDVYQQSIVVLAFFYRSKFKLIIWRGFSEYYSWDLALASIFLYESYKNDNGIAYAYGQSRKVTPQSLKSKIQEYHTKITNKTLFINKALDVEDAEAVETGGRERGIFGAKSKIDNIITIMRPKMRSLNDPDALMAEYQRLKTISILTLDPTDIAYIDEIIIALTEIKLNWIRMGGAFMREMSLALVNRETMVALNLPIGLILKDQAGLEIKFESGSRVSIASGFSMEKLATAPIEKNQVKLMYAYIRYHLKNSALDLKPIDNFIKNNVLTIT